MGIINSITKDSLSGSGNKTSVTYGDGDDMFSVNHLTSLGGEDAYASGSSPLFTGSPAATTVVTRPERGQHGPLVTWVWTG